MILSPWSAWASRCDRPASFPLNPSRPRCRKASRPVSFGGIRLRLVHPSEARTGFHNSLRFQDHVVMVAGCPRIGDYLEELEWAQGRRRHAIALKPEVFRVQILA